MAAGRIVLRAYGRTVAIEAPRECRELVLPRLPPTYRVSDADPEAVWRVRRQSPGWLAYRADGSPLGGGLDLAGTLDLALSDLELWVAEHARARTFVHAGCVVVDGRAILLPGRSHTGKSTLTATLVRAGATYYSDEYAVMDRRGLVRPYARPLSLRPSGGGVGEWTAVETIGGSAGRGPCPVGLIALLRYGRGNGWEVEQISRSQAVLHLLDNTVSAQSRPVAALNALEPATAGALAVLGRRDSAEEAADELLSLLGS